MMRGMQLNNSSLAINMRDNLLMDVIKIEDSDNDSDEDTLHIVEDSIDESIAIDDSESDEQAIVSFYFNFLLLFYFLITALLVYTKD